MNTETREYIRNFGATFGDRVNSRPTEEIVRWLAENLSARELSPSGDVIWTEEEALAAFLEVYPVPPPDPARTYGTLTI